jgi:ubiquitin-like protein Pup
VAHLETIPEMAMSQQESVQRSSSPSQAEDASIDTPAAVDRKTAIDADVDAILDEIDTVLEENSEEFVKSFVQKGGQ